MGVNLYREAVARQEKKLHTIRGRKTKFGASGDTIKVEITIPYSPEAITVIAFMSGEVVIHGIQKTIDEQISEEAENPPSEAPEDQGSLDLDKEGEDATQAKSGSLYGDLEDGQSIMVNVDEGIELGEMQYPKGTMFEILSIADGNETAEIAELKNPDSEELVGNGNPISVSADVIDGCFSE